TDEYEALKKRQDQVEDMEWQNHKNEFASEDKFEEYQEKEEKRIEKELEQIKDYRDTNEDAIEKVEDIYKNSKDKYEDLMEDLDDKYEDAEDIRKSEKGSLTGTIFKDLEKLEPGLTKILNEKLIEKDVKRELEKALGFLSSYYQQKEQGKVYIKSAREDERIKVLHVVFPRFSIDLKVDDYHRGQNKKRHLLSEILVDEINKHNDLENSGKFTTIFKVADTSLGEYFANKYMKDFGLSISNGLIKINPPVLKEEKAEAVEKAMLAITWSKYLKYVIAGLIVLLFIYMFFSKVDRKTKLKSVQRVFLVPSLLVLFLSFSVLLFSRFVLDYYPDLFTDIAVKNYFEAMAFVVAKAVFYPFLVVFGAMFLLGILIRLLRVALKA
ncbi:MAG: hypothetical protein AAF518_16335, partial [Spirochaetota bacterium]